MKNLTEIWPSYNMNMFQGKYPIFFWKSNCLNKILNYLRWDCIMNLKTLLLFYVICSIEVILVSEGKFSVHNIWNIIDEMSKFYVVYWLLCSLLPCY